MIASHDDLNVIRKIVWSYVKNNPGLEFDDLFAEACLVYVEWVIPNYDPTKGKISTFTYHLVNNHLKNLLTGKRRNKEILKDSAEGFENFVNDFELTPEQYLLAKEHWEEVYLQLSPEALVIWEIIYEEKEVFLPTDKPKLCRGILYRLLRERGWACEKIWETFREISAVVSASA